MSETQKLSAGVYFEQAVKNPIALVDKIDRHLRDKRVDFDTFVVTGISGAILGPLAAFTLDKNLLFVRKGESCHSFKQVAGNLGKRWVFLDDFIESGETLRRCMQRVREFAEDEGGYTPEGRFVTELVGVVQYGGDRLFGNPEMWCAYTEAAPIFEMYSERLSDEIELMKRIGLK